MGQAQFYSRQQAFGEGAGGGPMQSPSSLDDQGIYNSMVPTKFNPSSSLHQLALSSNGMSAKDAPRRLIGGGLLPTSNGSGTDTYEAKRPFMSANMNAVT